MLFCGRIKKVFNHDHAIVLPLSLEVTADYNYNNYGTILIKDMMK